MSNQIQKLIKRSKNPQLIQEAFEFAKEKYGDKKRNSSESYIDHALNVAIILSDIGLDEITIIAALLHDIADTNNPVDKQNILNAIEKKFGKEVAHIIDKTSQLNKIYYSTRGNLAEPLASKANIENLRKMFFAMAGDLRVILIDLASRIDGLNNINNLPANMQNSYVTETMQIFAPVANRLGLGEIKIKLEDLSFAFLYPKEYQWLQEHIKEKYETRQTYLKKFIPNIKKIFKTERIRYLDINYRAKSYWSTYQKLLTHNMDFEKIHDLVALRIIVNNVADCYKTLGIIHKHYKPISSEEINDYIAKPKINGYKSLHTTVFLDKDTISEIQIRTPQMHQDAQYGVCAHWSYKEKIDLQKRGSDFAWAKEIPEFWKTFNINFFSDQVFTFTPKGDVIVLPKDSTPIDFAYAVHSDVGNHCESAKIDGKIIPLTQQLHNGDVVEIITNKKRKPSQDWLKSVKTGFARSHIRKIITNIPVSLLSVPLFVKNKITEISKRSAEKREKKQEAKKATSNQIYLAGQKGIMTTIAKCCLPGPGDQVKAYLTKYRAAVLHKENCKNLQKIAQKFPEKVIEASWK